MLNSKFKSRQEIEDPNLFNSLDVLPEIDEVAKEEDEEANRIFREKVEKLD